MKLIHVQQTGYHGEKVIVCLVVTPKKKDIKTDNNGPIAVLTADNNGPIAVLTADDNGPIAHIDTNKWAIDRPCIP